MTSQIVSDPTCVSQTNSHTPFLQLPGPPFESEALTFPNVQPVNDNVTLEKLSLLELKVNDPDTLPEAPWRGPEKLSFELAEAQMDSASTNITETAANLE